MEVVDIMKNPERYAEVRPPPSSLFTSLFTSLFNPPPQTLSASGPATRRRQTYT